MCDIRTLLWICPEWKRKTSAIIQKEKTYDIFLESKTRWLRSRILNLRCVDSVPPPLFSLHFYVQDTICHTSSFVWVPSMNILNVRVQRKGENWILTTKIDDSRSQSSCLWFEENIMNLLFLNYCRYFSFSFWANSQ